jgi:arylsulfatase A-like enzyme
MSQVTTERRLWETVVLGLAARVRPLLRWGEGAPARPAPAAVDRARAELLSLALAVGTAIFLTKGFIAYRDLDNDAAPPQVCDGRAVATLARVWACCAEDFAVGLGCLLLARAALRWAGASWGLAAVRALAYLAAVIALSFLVVNAETFHVVRHYLTFNLVRLAGGVKLDRSIYDCATPPFKLALAWLPILTLAAHLWALQTFPGLWRFAARAGRPVLLLAGLFALAGVAAAARNGLVGADCDYPRNPHLHFVRSFLATGPRAAVAEGDAEEVADLVPGRPGHTPGLLARRPSNLIVITAESVAARYLETYGCPMATTPCLRRLDEQGKSLTFENFYATANHSIASALPIFGATYNDPTALATVIDYPDFPTPGAPAWLRGLGYTTGFFGSGGRRTWEGYRNMAAAFTVRGFDVSRDPRHPFWQARPRPDAFLGDEYLDEANFADVRRAVRQFRDRKFALWVWSYDAHSPYYDGPGPASFPREYFPAAIVGRPAREEAFRTYLRAVWRLDSLIGGLYRELEDLGLADDTLVVVTGDHGEEFGEHGWFGHNWSLYEAEVRVPCVFIGPRLAPLGRRSRVVGGHVDLWATITDVCGLPADPRWQGRSLVSGGAAGRRAYFYRHDGGAGVREGRYKYVWDYQQGRELLFDVEADPAEKRDLSAGEPGLCLALRRRVTAWTAFQARLTKQRLAEDAR